MGAPQLWGILKLCILSAFTVVDAFHDADELTGTLPFFSERFSISPRNDYVGSVGFSFTTVRNFAITALGRPLTSGLSALQSSIRVSLWDATSQAEIAFADVGPLSAVEDLYAYEVLATPVQVDAGKEYRLSIWAQASMPDAWIDGSPTAADLQAGSATEYATILKGVSANTGGSPPYPAEEPQLRRRAGIATFRVAYDCAAPSGILHAGEEPCVGISGNGSSTGHVPNGENCTTQCDPGYTPSISSLACTDGVLFPAVFGCSPSACATLIVSNALDPPCLEGYSTPPGSICTAQCSSGYTPSTQTLNCSYGQFTPLTFTCDPNPCSVLLPFVGSAGQPCSDGFVISSGGNCSTECANGYTPSKPLLLCNLGTLSPGGFTCSPNPCVAPIVGKAMSPSCRQGASILSGENCTTWCKSGYTASVDTLHCSLGSLTPSSFTCFPSQCDIPLMDDNTASPLCSEGNLIESGDSCTPRCRPGYMPSLPFLNCSFGELTPANFTCLPSSCPVPSGIAHAAPEGLCIEGYELTSGSACTVRCAEGFSASVDTLLCSLGQLSLPNITLCAPSRCQPPPINGAADPPCAEGSSVESGESCTPQCTSGHTPSLARLNCSYGELSPSNFSCDPNPCSVPQGILHAVSPVCLGGALVLQSGSTCKIQCEPGYTANSLDLACDYGALSPPSITCSPSPCVVPTSGNIASPACLQGSSIASGGTCTAACNLGFTPSVDNLTCSFGVLTPPNFTCYYDPCMAPTGISNSYSPTCVEGELVASGLACSPRCLPGYDASAASLLCVAGALTPSSFTCSPRPCIAPTVGQHVLGCAEGTNILSGGTCTAVCEEGFLPTPPSLSCSLGVFDPFGFQCNGDACAVPIGIPNAAANLCAEVSDGQNISHGEFCSLQCAIGYTPTVVSLNCTAGQLSPSSFACIPSSCVPPIGIENALVPCSEGNSIGHGQTCTAQCDTGYKPSLTNLSCNFGDLTPQDFTCVGDPCLIPPAPDFGLEWPCGDNISLIAHGSNCTGQCQDGYTAFPIGLLCAGTKLNPPNFTCNPSACTARSIPNAMKPSCLEGATIEHDGDCTPQCQVGFQPTLTHMKCRYGQFRTHDGRGSFDCTPLDCFPPKTWFALQPCVEGAVVPSGGQCTAQCAHGFTPSVPYLNCSLGTLTPPSFMCLGEECPVPSDVEHIADAPCAGGNATLVAHRGICRPQCVTGYLPSVMSLDCYNGTLSPLPLTCWHCPEVADMMELNAMQRRGSDPGLAGVVTRAESMACAATPQDHWCHNRCGALRVSYTTSTRGLMWVAMALFRPATCAEFPPWYPSDHLADMNDQVTKAICSEFSPWCPSSDLARTDVLVTTVADMKDLHANVLGGNGFRGVIVLIAFECGALHVPPPSLRCWQSRTVLVGADRFAGLHNYGGYLEMPPALISWLTRKSSQPSSSYAEIESTLTQPTRDLVNPKTRLLAYLSDVCSPEEETFFDLAVEALQGYGSIEALGRCHGSHPELVPKACVGSCEYARQNPIQALRPFKFALAFDASAGSQDHCAKHITHRAFDAFAAGAVPVYRGPDETFAVLNHHAIIHVHTHRSLQESVMAFRAVVLDSARTLQKMAVAAMTADARSHWFRSEEALKGVHNDLTREAQNLVAPMLRGAPHWRCAEQELLRTPLPCEDGSQSPATCTRSTPVHSCVA